MGIYPGVGGTQYLTGLVGRARAVEVILGIAKTTVAAADHTRTDLVAESSLAARLSFPEVAALAQKLLAAEVQTREVELRPEEVLNETFQSSAPEPPDPGGSIQVSATDVISTCTSPHDP